MEETTRSGGVRIVDQFSHEQMWADRTSDGRFLIGFYEGESLAVAGEMELDAQAARQVAAGLRDLPQTGESEHAHGTVALGEMEPGLWTISGQTGNGWQTAMLDQAECESLAVFLSAAPEPAVLPTSRLREFRSAHLRVICQEDKSFTFWFIWGEQSLSQWMSNDSVGDLLGVWQNHEECESIGVLLRQDSGRFRLGVRTDDVEFFVLLDEETRTRLWDFFQAHEVQPTIWWDSEAL